MIFFQTPRKKEIPQPRRGNLSPRHVPTPFYRASPSLPITISLSFISNSDLLEWKPRVLLPPVKENLYLPRDGRVPKVLPHHSLRRLRGQHGTIHTVGLVFVYSMTTTPYLSRMAYWLPHFIANCFIDPRVCLLSSLNSPTVCKWSTSCGR